MTSMQAYFIMDDDRSGLLPVQLAACCVVYGTDQGKKLAGIVSQPAWERTVLHTQMTLCSGWMLMKGLLLLFMDGQDTRKSRPKKPVQIDECPEACYVAHMPTASSCRATHLPGFGRRSTCMSAPTPLQAAQDRLPAWTDLPDPRAALAAQDPDIFEAIELERGRQFSGIELIASENYVSPAVLAAMGSVLTNKYAEGYPGKRYYGGCDAVDVAEELAIARAKLLFGADHANVQPHSGAQANEAVYLALINPGDTVLGLKLDHGGHLTHGFRLNSSGKLYNFVHYGVRPDTERIDYDEV